MVEQLASIGGPNPDGFTSRGRRDEKGAFKNVSSAAGVIGCVDGSVAVIIPPKGDHHKAASYSCKKHYADIVMLVCDVDMGILSRTTASGVSRRRLRLADNAAAGAIRRGARIGIDHTF
ncbi:hypothetical protein MTO96_006357 [Rhipicephalus appendiculatus]